MSGAVTSRTTNVTAAYREARDQLLELRDQYDRAVSEFVWPTIDGPFNWACDWFDAIAAGNDRDALVIVEEDGRVSRQTFDEVRRRSNQVAAWMRGLGVAKGDPVILMLGNQVEL